MGNLIALLLVHSTAALAGIGVGYENFRASAYFQETAGDYDSQEACMRGIQEARSRALDKARDLYTKSLNGVISDFAACNKTVGNSLTLKDYSNEVTKEFVIVHFSPEMQRVFYWEEGSLKSSNPNIEGPIKFFCRFSDHLNIYYPNVVYSYNTGEIESDPIDFFEAHIDLSRMVLKNGSIASDYEFSWFIAKQNTYKCPTSQKSSVSLSY